MAKAQRLEKKFFAFAGERNLVVKPVVASLSYPALKKVLLLHILINLQK
jgi:hypothetical protein